MLDKDPGLTTWMWGLLTTGIVGAFSFIMGMNSFKSKATVRDASIEKELGLIQKDIARLEVLKVDKERLNIVLDDIKRLDNTKADKEVILLMQNQISEISTDIKELLSRIPK